MRKTHELNGFAFPNLTHSLLDRNKELAKRYISAIFLAGADVCIPDGATVQILTMLSVKHLNADPKDLAASPSPWRIWHRLAHPCVIPP
jgi:hypothetical protein